MNRCAILVEKANAGKLFDIGVSLGILTTESKNLKSDCDQSELNDNDVGIAEIDGWGVLFTDCLPFLEQEPKLSRFSENTKIFFWLTESTSAGLWFEYHVNGVLIRKWIEIESKVLVNEGDALVEEPVGFFTSEDDEDGERDEWKIVDLAEKVTKVPSEKLFSDIFDIYR